MTDDLANELEPLLERFARESGFDERRPVWIGIGRGVVGHHQEGRAVDIYEVGGVGLRGWFEDWRKAQCVHPSSRSRSIERERRRNLGWRLYTVLRVHGRWCRPLGFPVQLFGPWTRTDGPLKTISDRLLNAHRDHIHVAR
jgi:hypothetical protein